MFNRLLNIQNISKSCFIFGPRQTGKTTLVGSSLKDTPHLRIDLLKYEEFIRYAQNIPLFRKEISVGIENSKYNVVVVDEVQKLPVLLDEVHSLLEQYSGRIKFILTGSSARKLKRQGVNLLAGRAWIYHLHPLTYRETGDLFDLEKVLQFGSLPQVFQEPSNEARLTLEAYTTTYLKEEIAQEALVRNLGQFNRFLELASFESGNVINYATLSREIGLSSNAIKEYYQILEDTLLSHRVPPFVKSIRKRISKHPKIYFFDCGVTNAFTRQLSTNLIAGSPLYGKLFEQFVVLELFRLVDYCHREIKISYLRLHSGLEIDLILEEGDRLIAVEIKSSAAPQAAEVKHLVYFGREFPNAKLYLVCATPRAYKIDSVEVVPWKEFFNQLFFI